MSMMTASQSGGSDEYIGPDGKIHYSQGALAGVDPSNMATTNPYGVVDQAGTPNSGGALAYNSGGTGPPTGTTAGQNDAIGLIDNELDQWGLGGLASWAWQEITSGKSLDQVVHDLRQTDVYRNSIFGRTNAQRADAGLPPMTEAEVLAYKNRAYEMAHAAGLPAGFMTDAEIASLAGQNVSPAELNERINVAYLHASQAPDDYRQQLAARGVDTGHLAAYYLDPGRALPFLKQQELSADVSVAAQRAGFGGVAISDADRLAQEGVSESQARTGFGHLASLDPLFHALPGSQEEEIGTQVALGAEFEANAQDQLMIQRRQEARKAAFQGGGRFGENQKGIEGLGEANPV